MKDDRVRGLGSVTWKGCEWVEVLVVRARLTGSGIVFLISDILDFRNNILDIFART